MNLKWIKLLASALIVGLSLGTAPCSAQGEGHNEGNVFVPDTSIELPGDAGNRSHTNHLLVIKPKGGLGPGGGMTPAQILAFYGITAGGGHDTIVIVDAFDYATALNDFNVFSNKFGLPVETSPNATASTNKVFQVVYQGGNRPRGNTGWAQEAALDIEWAHAMAPNAKIVLMEAQTNSNANLYAAIDQAVLIPGVTQISMSWGSSEFSSETSLDPHFNINTMLNNPVFFASSGDTGGKAIYPSTSPYVVAVGGTSVATNSSGGLTGETGWSGSGGGKSLYETIPTYQSGISSIVGSVRGVPDISSDADPNTGVAVYGPISNGRSTWLVFGGTSVSSPCMAGMVNAGGGTYTNTTTLLTNIYSHKGTSSFRDIISGTAGSFSCLSGWDFVTGVGTPQGFSGFLP